MEATPTGMRDAEATFEMWDNLSGRMIFLGGKDPAKPHLRNLGAGDPRTEAARSSKIPGGGHTPGGGGDPRP